MSAFALVVRRDGEPVREHERAGVRAPFQHRNETLREFELGPGAWLVASHDEAFEAPADVWQSGDAGVCAISRHGVDASGRAALAAELAAAHPVPTQVAFPFVAVAWRPGEERVFVDQLGTRSAWFAQSGPVTVVASESRTVVAHPQVSADVDLGILAERLAYAPSTPHRSIYRSARLVPAGSWLSISTGGVLRVHRWHEWNVEPDLDTEGWEWVEQFREATEAAVADAVVQPDASGGASAPMSLALSGGLDSSSLAGVISKLGFGDRTVATCWRYPGLPCDESDFQQAVLSRTGLEAVVVDHRPLDFERDVARPIEQMGTPFFRVAPEEDDGARVLAERGVHRHITGIGGDELFLGYEDRLVDALADGRTDDAARLLRAQSPRGQLRSHRSWLRTSVRVRHRRFRPPSWIGRDFADEVGLAERMEQERELAGRRGRAETRLYDLVGSGWSTAVADADEASRARLGREPVHPFLHPDLVQLALRTPDAVRSTTSDNRALQREVFADVLPVALRRRRGKVHFDYRHAIDLGNEDVVRVLSDLQLADDGFVDGAEVMRMHRTLMAAVQTDIATIPALATKLWAVVCHELWWRQVR